MGDGFTHVDGGGEVRALPLKGAQVNPFLPFGGFQIAVLQQLPFVPTDLTILLVIPVNCVDLPAFPATVFLMNALSIFVQFKLGFALGEPFSLLIQTTHGEQHMGVRIAVPFIVDSEITAHSFAHKLLPAILANQSDVVLVRQLFGEGDNDSPGKLAVIALFCVLHTVPERSSVGKYRRRTFRKQHF